ncbi:MCE family protein, partial [Nocardia miyunensis]|uniref:MCE family protein n=1 Tax=Nocardia miyunensis TaxID=282684 RepID=UPI001FDEA63F
MRRQMKGLRIRGIPWRSKPLEEYSRVSLGVLALGGLTVAIVIALTVNLTVDSINFGDKDVQVDFAQAAQLGAGDRVTIAGVPVGHVTTIRLTDGHVAVTLSVHRSVHLGADTTAAIELTTLLGNRYVELDPAGAGNSDRIPLQHSSVPYDLESALADATTTFSQVDADQVAKALTDLTGRLDGLPQLIPSVMENVRTLSSVIAERRGQIGALLASTSKLTGVLNSQQTDLGALFDQGGDMLHQLLTRKQAIESMVAATTTLVDRLTPLAVQDQPEIHSLLGNLREITAMLSRHDDLLRNILQALPVPWRSWANLTGTGPELDATASSGAFVDSFMCTLVSRAPQVHLSPYSEECR